MKSYSSHKTIRFLPNRNRILICMVIGLILTATAVTDAASNPEQITFGHYKSLMATASHHLSALGTAVLDGFLSVEAGADGTDAVYGFSVADFDQDGDVDLADLRVFVFCWLEERGLPDYIAEADFDDNGIINLTDFAIFAKHWMHGPKEDLTVETSDIEFSLTEPFVGDTVNISATIHNIGGYDASNVAVQFFDGYPDAEGELIASYNINSIPAGSSKIASVDWNAAEWGIHKIYVVIDPANEIEELNERNNQAGNAISVQAGIISKVTLFPGQLVSELISDSQWRDLFLYAVEIGYTQVRGGTKTTYSNWMMTICGILTSPAGESIFIVVGYNPDFARLIKFEENILQLFTREESMTIDVVNQIVTTSDSEHHSCDKVNCRAGCIGATIGPGEILSCVGCAVEVATTGIVGFLTPECLGCEFAVGEVIGCESNCAIFPCNWCYSDDCGISSFCSGLCDPPEGGRDTDLYQRRDYYYCSNPWQANSQCKKGGGTKLYHIDCLDTVYDDWGPNRCTGGWLDGAVVHDRTFTEGGCSDGFCYTNPGQSETEIVQDCGVSIWEPWEPDYCYDDRTAVYRRIAHLKYCENAECISRDETQIDLVDCGVTTYDQWGAKYCQGGDVVRDRTVHNKGCSGGACYDYDTTETEVVQDCGTTTYGPWGANYCSGKNIVRDRTVHNKGCSNGECYSYDSTQTQTVDICLLDCVDGQCITGEFFQSTCDLPKATPIPEGLELREFYIEKYDSSSIRAYYKVKNTGSSSLTFSPYGVKVACRDPDDVNCDLPATGTFTLASGSTYSQEVVAPDKLNKVGTWTFWVAYKCAECGDEWGPNGNGVPWCEIQVPYN